MRSYTRTLITTFILTLCLFPANAQDQRPNIVLILADDMTWTDAGCYGNPDVKTPHLDQLAREGLRFNHAYTATAMCSPTRQMLYTGIYPVKNGAYPNHSRVYDPIQSLPTYLKDLGYRVALAGKEHFAPRENFPFEILSGKPLLLNKAKAFMTRNDDQPFCLVVCSTQPHTPWDHGDPNQYDPDQLTLPPYLPDTPDTRKAMQHYYAEVSHLDFQVGKTLELLEESQQSDNTLVMFLSEQGAGTPFAKWTLYDAGIRAQCIVRWPDHIAPNTTTNAMIEYVDVLPTFIELAQGIPSPALDGKSFLKVLQGETNNHKKQIFAVHTNNGIRNGKPYPIRAIRDKQYKLIWNLMPDATFHNNLTERDDYWYFIKSWRKSAAAGHARANKLVERYTHRPQFELYDTLADPHELNNLAAVPAHEERINTMLQQLKAWMKSQGDEGVATEEKALTRFKDKNRIKKL